MDTEITQHNDLHTWDLVQLLPNRIAIGSRWAFVVKTNANGIFELPRLDLLHKALCSVRDKTTTILHSQWSKWTAYVLFLPLESKITGRCT